MRITKFPQSCVVIEGSGGGRALVDPGNVAMDAVDFDAFGAIDTVLFTHRHADHFDPRALAAIQERGLEIHANADVCGLIGDGATAVTDGQTFTTAGFEITAHDLPHVTLVDGSPGPPNTGFVFDGHLLHPGDSLQVAGLRVDAFALPVAGPDVSFRDAYVALETTGATTAVPIHYDVFIVDPAVFTRYCDIAEVIILDHGDSTDL
ncbi:MAG TPA: MBL fold metallo-hydrolase [Euzebyales bacterium]|nr:MBL fold metallo-hydrolase [Euzebyales bacterium]